MEQKEKLRVLLAHWIEHNKGHGEECSKWAAISREEGMPEVASSIDRAVKAIEETNRLLAKALQEAGGPVDTGAGEHHHHH